MDSHFEASLEAPFKRTPLIIPRIEFSLFITLTVFVIEKVCQSMEAEDRMRLKAISDASPDYLRFPSTVNGL